ncbi:arginase [Alicyclobacillus acidocaldarius]|uniref:Arginase n=1 Tax=Alicyclobacillus acidocaldarius subsp. acidocaldarius (strain ATCC 27009 / DSM 446 / BCRC 14685 / JCM 5260 / KCTC 1825 / NBRC 15652 / NCIMB 11725 / NRRL B-14509 / 104-IA) TaxID=521098 RepID=C8WRH5_ALIAD|nr:arginase [Alicyclobacillus acidocaldarius]ACV57380.1 arginase [Alicyclobacillus acidocaldarius subsp. acidocaldarius DSM 446]
MKDIHIIGVPSDYGQNRRGVDMGPSAIRYAGLKEKLERLGYEVSDLGDVPVPTPETRQIEHQKLKYLREVVSVCEALCEKVDGVLKGGHTPVILGGDHSIAIGSLAGIARAGQPFGVIWFDAHGDMNTDETTPSGNIHGMPLAASLGLGHEALTGIGGIRPKVKPENVVLVGARSIDPEERELIRRSGIHVFTMQDVDRRGMDAVMQEAIRIASDGTRGIHLSLDLDALDPMFAPGVGTPVNGGFTYREGHLAMELLAASGKLLSVDVVEVNPILDHRNQTGRMAVELLESLFGKRVM